jgi:hypothetical protein
VQALEHAEELAGVTRIEANAIVAHKKNMFVRFPARPYLDLGACRVRVNLARCRVGWRRPGAASRNRLRLPEAADFPAHIATSDHRCQRLAHLFDQWRQIDQ